MREFEIHKKDENVCPGERRYVIHIILMPSQCDY